MIVASNNVMDKADSKAVAKAVFKAICYVGSQGNGYLLDPVWNLKLNCMSSL